MKKIEETGIPFESADHAEKKMQLGQDCVGVIDDDMAVRMALRLMLAELGIDVLVYASADEFLADADGRNRCSCLVLDVRLPGISGLELQKQLLKLSRMPAIIFISGYVDVQTAVEAMRYGAIDFLQKPFKEQQLLDSVQKALILERRSREARNKSESVKARLACLTSREHDVLEKLLQGLRTKEIAVELGLSTKTAEGHRASILRKMHVSTVAELVSIYATPRECPEFCIQGHCARSLISP